MALDRLSQASAGLGGVRLECLLRLCQPKGSGTQGGVEVGPTRSLPLSMWTVPLVTLLSAGDVVEAGASRREGVSKVSGSPRPSQCWLLAEQSRAKMNCLWRRKAGPWLSRMIKGSFS